MAVSLADAPTIPTVKWDDVGGLADVKREILDVVCVLFRTPRYITLGRLTQLTRAAPAPWCAGATPAAQPGAVH
jgi:hypothetical protein